MAVTETESPPVAKQGSLKPVIEVIPAECYERPTARGLGYFFRDIVVYGLILWGLASTDAIWLLVPLWLLAGLAVGGLFVVGHDAAHQALFESRRLNGVVGRIAMLPSLHVFEAWVLGHNRIHHGHTIREGMDFVWHPLTPEQYGELRWWSKALHKVEWSLVGYGIYYGRQVWWQKMISFRPPEKWARAVHRDAVIMWSSSIAAAVGFAALGWWSYGSVLGAAWMIVKLAIIPFIVFCYVIGLVVHVHHIDRTITWSTRRSWTKYHGQVEGTTIIHAPGWLNFFLHWILVHSPHHVDMRIPMYHLKRAGRAITDHFPVPERKLRVRDIVVNTRACKLYDFDEGRWLTYRSARRDQAAAAAA